MTVKRKTKQTKKEKPKIPRTSRKITKQHKTTATIRENHDIPYKPGDLCFYLTRNNKVYFAEVYLAHENEQGHYYELIDLFDFRYVTVLGKYCADDEKSLKGKKWSK